MGLKDIGSTLPPGFRFYPSDEELVCHYLYKKIANDHEDALKGSTLVDIDLHTCEPWQLPDVAKLNASEWYFFSFRDRKYATGYRANRATTAGYWKATGKDRMVIDPTTKQIVGMRKTLVFYRNRAPNGIKTAWIMHEFRLETPHMPPKEDWVLCRVFNKGKGEDSNELSPQIMYETSTGGVPSLSFSASPLTNKILQSCDQYQQLTSYSSTPTHHQQYNFLQDKNINCLTEINSDEYSFLWDMNLDENNYTNNNGLEDQGVPSNMEEMRFEIDNSMVFL